MLTFACFPTSSLHRLWLVCILIVQDVYDSELNEMVLNTEHKDMSGYGEAPSSSSSRRLSFKSLYVFSKKGNEVLQRGKSSLRLSQPCTPFSFSLQATDIETSQSALFMSELSVLLQSFGQQVVKAGNHRPGIIVQACCDHGVVVDLFQ